MYRNRDDGWVNELDMLSFHPDSYENKMNFLVCMERVIVSVAYTLKMSLLPHHKTVRFC